MKKFTHLLLAACTIISTYSYCATSTLDMTDQEFMQHKLKQFNLLTPQCMFRYCFDVEIATSLTDQSFELDPFVDQYAHKKYDYLNKSPYYDIKFVLQPPKVRSYQTKKKIDEREVGKLITFTTVDGVELGGTYFDRGSDTLVIVGPGFTNEREKMAPFVHVFSDQDLLIFDYRGHGITKSTLFEPSSWNFSLVNNLFGVDTKQARLGLIEENDIHAAVTALKERKHYRKVVGVGICYSAMIFVKAASLYPDLFTHIIADGCWYSLKNFTEKLSHDLKMLVSPQRGGWQDWWVTKNEWSRSFIVSASEKIFGLKFESVSIFDYLPHLSKDISILFWHGKNDLVISRGEFEKVWHATPCHNKTAIISSNPHVWNHLKQKELYKLVNDLFINQPYGTFVDCLKDKEKLLEIETKNMRNV